MKDFLKTIVWGGIFLMPFITLFVANDLFFPFITGKNFAFRITVTVILAAWVLLALLDTEYRPRWSWLLGGFGVLVVIMFFANLFGVHPHTSFWSNYERMDGWVTLIHLFAYIVVAASTLRTAKHWQWFWYASLAAAVIVGINGLSEALDPNIGRIASYLGNAAYFAIYLLFHIFLIFFLFVREQNIYLRTVYAVLAVLFSYLLLETGTRGTVIGLAAGVGAMVLYIGIFARRYPQFRLAAIASLVLFVVLIGSFIGLRDSEFVQSSSTMNRIANIDLQRDLQVRGTIWGMAWEGVQERPVLGWGQGNFNFVFNQNYDPFLYDQEQWFDRVHNIVFDWLIAGGFLGAAAYFSIFIAFFYYLFWRPLRQEEETFTVLERGVLIGLLVGYLTHNFVVFDNIVSYIFFASVVAMVHARVSVPIERVQNFTMPQVVVTQTLAPIMVVVALATIYFVNIPSLQAAGDILQALRSSSIEDRQAAFERAINRGGLGNQEIAEQFGQDAMRRVQDQSIPQDVRSLYASRAEAALLAAAEQKPGDARIHVFLASFYRGIGMFDAAAEQFALARELSPRKQSIIMQQGVTAYSLGEQVEALAFFREAYELDYRNREALVFVIATHFSLGEIDEALASLATHAGKAVAERVARTNPDVTRDELIALSSEERQERLLTIDPDAKMLIDREHQTVMRELSENEFARSMIEQSGEYELLAEIYELRVELDPDDPQRRASLAFIYYQLGNIEKALEVLAEAAEVAPEFRSVAECISENIEAGREPQEGC